MHRKDYIFSQNRFIAHCLPHLWPLLHILAISSKISSFYKEKVPDILIAAHVNSFVYRDIWVEKRTMAYLMKTLFVPYGLCHSWFWNSELVFLGSVIQISSEGRHTVCHNKIFKIKTQEEYLQTQQDHLIYVQITHDSCVKTLEAHECHNSCSKYMSPKGTNQPT